jgi:2-hydroxy-3-keto-5-methylthiopentenyl-1-phosphate phosphatase
VDKGLLVRKAIQWGYIVCGGGGDSRNDIGIAQAVGEVQGFVIAKRNLGLANWCKAYLDGEFHEFEDFREVMPYVQQTLSDRGLLKRSLNNA